MPPTPVVPVSVTRRPYRDPAATPPPTVRFAAAAPPPAPPVDTPPPGSSYSGGFDSSPAAPPADAPVMPDVGDTFHGFELVSELGRGTFARVFLAKQAALAGRLVALKVSLRATREPDRLARLQHTNVVPVYSVHSAGPVQLICMPFLGPHTLADALKSHRSSARSGSRSGSSRKATRAQRASATVTDAPAAPAGGTSGVFAPAPAAPTPVADMVGDPAAVLRLLSHLAAGLEHAHGRGILHLDIKPGNVLLADTGEPMLLDFNLSADAAEADRELIGGTVPYMAPEQLQDMRTRGRGAIDRRTDLYGLGIVAYELLAGRTPFAGSTATLALFDALIAVRKKGPPPLRPANPGVTPATEAIVRKLLAPEPQDRYQTAAELKEDVDRQLADRPLRHAANPSVRERAGKWWRRHPGAVVAAGVLGLFLIAGGTTAAAVESADRRASAEAVVQAGIARDKLSTYRVSLVTPDSPMERASVLERSRKLLAEYQLPAAMWPDTAAARRLPPAARDALAGDLGELLVLLGRNRLAAANDADGDLAAAARREAAAYATAAAGCFAAPPPALARLAADLGLPHAPPAAAATARDHFLDGAELVDARRDREAVARLEDATFADPGHAAAHYLLGVCLERLGEPARAAERFAVAAGLMPTNHRPFGSWGKVEAAAGRFDRAVRVYDLALARDRGPELAGLFRYFRGLALLNAGRPADAAEEFTTVLGTGSYAVGARLGRAAAWERLADPAAAAADRAAALRLTPVRYDDWTALAWAKQKSDPDGARADIERALALAGYADPSVFGAHVRLTLAGADAASAARAAEAALVRFPQRAEFHALRAVALARQGRAGDARAAAAAAAGFAPTAEDRFTAACALAAAGDPDAALAELRRAYRDGFRDLARLDAAPDLAAARDTAAYRTFRAAVGELTR